MRIRKTLWNNDAEPIMVIMAILVVLGTINVFSSSYVLATIDYENPYYFLTRHLIWLVVGVAAFVGCRHINYRRWRIVMPWLLLGMFAALSGSARSFWRRPGAGFPSAASVFSRRNLPSCSA